jgi:hypothetical protein
MTRSGVASSAISLPICPAISAGISQDIYVDYQLYYLCKYLPAAGFILPHNVGKHTRPPIPAPLQSQYSEKVQSRWFILSVRLVWHGWKEGDRLLN